MPRVNYDGIEIDYTYGEAERLAEVRAAVEPGRPRNAGRWTNADKVTVSIAMPSTLWDLIGVLAESKEISKTRLICDMLRTATDGTT